MMPDQPPGKPMNEHERLWLQKCIEAFRAENYDALLKAAVELENVTSNPATASMYVGIAYYHKGMFEQARKTFYDLHLMLLARERRTDPNVVFYLAMCDIYLGRVDGAIMLLEKLEAKFPENVDYKMMLYLALYMKGDVEQGNLELAEAFAVDPKRAGETLESMMLKALENLKLSGTSKVLIMQLLKKLKSGEPG
jgi:tetratricopeptide (TPR) repeat protein